MPHPLLLHGKHGGVEVEYRAFGEWLVPWRCGSSGGEYDTLKRAAGLIDVSTYALIEVRGADRAGFLQNLLTNDVKRLSAGSGARAALLTPDAKLIAELLVIVDPDAIWMLCDAIRSPRVTDALERYLFSEQVAIGNHDRSHAVLALQGPRAIECVSGLCGGIVSVPGAQDHRLLTLQGVPVRVVRHALIGGVGVLLIFEREHAPMLWRWLLHAGLEFGMQPAGWEAANIVRIESGIPWEGLDAAADRLLPETGLQAATVSGAKGCYVGQEIIARLQTYGSLNKKLMGLLIDGQQPAEPGDRILRQNREAGQVTSACRSMALGRPIALGYVKRGVYEPGTSVEIMRDQRRLPATVVERPFVA